MVEVLKQPASSPFPVEREVVSIWAGTTGKFDDLEVADVRPFEAQLHDYIAHNRQVIFTTIAENSVLDDDTIGCAGGGCRRGEAAVHRRQEGRRGRRRGGEGVPAGVGRHQRHGNAVGDGRSASRLPARVRSVQSTRKITKAMELIAASRIAKAQARMRRRDPTPRS